MPASQAGRESLYTRESRGWRRLTGRSARARAFITDPDGMRSALAELFFEMAWARRLPGMALEWISRDIAGTLTVVVFAGHGEYRGLVPERVRAAGTLPAIPSVPLAGEGSPPLKRDRHRQGARRGEKFQRADSPRIVQRSSFHPRRGMPANLSALPAVSPPLTLHFREG